VGRLNRTKRGAHAWKAERWQTAKSKGENHAPRLLDHGDNHASTGVGQGGAAHTPILALARTPSSMPVRGRMEKHRHGAGEDRGGHSVRAHTSTSEGCGLWAVGSGLACYQAGHKVHTFEATLCPEQNPRGRGNGGTGGRGDGGTGGRVDGGTGGRGVAAAVSTTSDSQLTRWGPSEVGMQHCWGPLYPWSHSLLCQLA
jgi:hypothetical protein